MSRGQRPRTRSEREQGGCEAGNGCEANKRHCMVTLGVRAAALEAFQPHNATMCGALASGIDTILGNGACTAGTTTMFGARTWLRSRQ